MKYRILWPLVLTLLLSACSAGLRPLAFQRVTSTVPPGDGFPMPSPLVLGEPTSTATSDSLTFESPLGTTLSPLPTPRARLETASPQLLPTRQPTPTLTPTPLPTPMLPDVENLHWQTLGQAGSTVRQLAGLATTWLDVAPSPDGRWLATEFLEPTDSYWGYREALYVLDEEGDRHWFTGTFNDNPLFHWHDWLPDGRLIWIDAGELFMADAGGGNRHRVQTPEAMREVWSANKIALVGGATQLWCLDPTSLRWEAVSGLDADDHAGVSRGRANLSLDSTGEFAAVIQVVDSNAYLAGIWRVPLAFGAPAERIGTVPYTTLEGRLRAPDILAGPYWWINEACALLDTRDGSTRSIQSLLAEFEDTSAASRPLRQHGLMSPTRAGGCYEKVEVSPDGRWLALRTMSNEGDRLSQPVIVIVSAENLSAEPVILKNADFVGWRIEPAAAFVRMFDEDLRDRLVQVSLSQDSEVPLADDLLEHSRVFVDATPNATFVVDQRTDSLRFQAFAPDGQLLSSLEVPYHDLFAHARDASYYLQRGALTALSDGDALLSLSASGGTGLWHWLLEQQGET